MWKQKKATIFNAKQIISFGQYGSLIYLNYILLLQDQFKEWDYEQRISDFLLQLLWVT